LFIALLVVFGCEDNAQEKVYGCTDSTACNFNSDATIFDNSCYYAICELLGTWELSLVLNTEDAEECFLDYGFESLISLSGDTMEIDWLNFITFYDDSFYQCNTLDEIDLNYYGSGTGTYTIGNIYDKWSNKNIVLEDIEGSFVFIKDDAILIRNNYVPPIGCIKYIYYKSESISDSTHCQ
jgi:hypothetical protein